MSDLQNTSAASDPLPVATGKKKSFAGDVLKIMGGTAFGQVLGIAALPILTRLFSPEAFGLLGVYGALTGIIGVVVCMRYELTIVLPKEDRDAANLFWVSIGFIVLWTAATGMVILFFGRSLAEILNIPSIGPILWLIPIGIFIRGIYTALSHWNTRRAQFGRLAAAQINNAIVTSGSKVAAGFAGLTSGGALVAASLTGSVTAAAVLGRRIWREDGARLRSNISFRHACRLMREYKNISIFNSLSSIFNTFSQSLPLLFLGTFFGANVVGFYALGRTVLKMPLNLIGSSTKKVFLQKATEEWNNKQDVSQIVLTVVAPLSIISLVLLTGLVLTATPIVNLVFGESWSVSADYLKWMAIYTALMFASSPLPVISHIFQMEHVQMFFQIARTAIGLSMILIGGLWFDDPYITIALFSIGIGVYQIVYFVWIFRLSNASLLSLIERIKASLIISIGALLFYTILALFDAAPPLVALGVGIGYGIVMLTLNRNIIRNLIRKKTVIAGA